MSARAPVGLLSFERKGEGSADANASKPVDPNAPKCAACGRYHGSINVELRCLREGLQRQREAIERQGKQLVLLRAMLGREDDK